MTTRTATKRPDDKPFDFNLDAVEAEVDLAPWCVNWGSKPWTFQHAEALDIWKIASAAETGDLESTIAVVRIALGPKQWEEFEKLPMPQYKLKALFKAYREHCGMAEGESEASSDS